MTVMEFMTKPVFISVLWYSLLLVKLQVLAINDSDGVCDRVRFYVSTVIVWF